MAIPQQWPQKICRKGGLYWGVSLYTYYIKYDNQKIQELHGYESHAIVPYVVSKSLSRGVSGFC